MKSCVRLNINSADTKIPLDCPSVKQLHAVPGLIEKTLQAAFYRSSGPPKTQTLWVFLICTNFNLHCNEYQYTSVHVYILLQATHRTRGTTKSLPLSLFLSFFWQFFDIYTLGVICAETWQQTKKSACLFACQYHMGPNGIQKQKQIGPSNGKLNTSDRKRK